ncbi:diacylglycerol kinase [Streptomyces roseicoloratus]|uniref:Diacylglycerol kinase n=1 Tax=Streptomyces roseicoloratus TaxID=2508722 RepID=A0ABY9RVS5_9ACTN|nr:diacylglycerol kinase [Streptomyces roseicoloratus]WMX46286.1 diacylglycerol kinase [Streptomyces roseicoloratus]
MSAHDQLLVIIDPVARRSDGESVRIAKDVLSAGAEAKICLPDDVEEFARALARRGSRRPVVLGDDRALLRAVTLLHRERETVGGTLSLVPIGAPDRVATAHALGVPPGTVAASRAVLDGTVRRLDLLVDDSDGVVLDHLDVPAARALAAGPDVAPAPAGVWGTCRSLVRTLVRPAPTALADRTHRLRVEADGVLLTDLDTPVTGLTARALAGTLSLTLLPAGSPPVHTTARTLTVAGPDFRYRADTTVSGPVRWRTWTVRAGAWGLTVPREGGRDAS